MKSEFIWIHTYNCSCQILKPVENMPNQDMIPLFLMWILCQERNRTTFEDL